MASKMKNPYLPAAISMYINYIIVGISAVALTLNMDSLMEQMHTTRAGIGLIVGAVGIGKLIVLLASGILSDKLGRRPFIQAGAICYILAYIGILFSPNIVVGYILGLIMGFANSFMDAGTYPALMESFPKAQGTANIIVKAFCSIGSFGFPLIVGFITANGMYYGWSLILLAVILLVNGIVLQKLTFPPLSSKSSDAEEAKAQNVVQFKGTPNFWIEGLCLICIGFTCSVTFDTIAKWVPTFAQDVVGMGATSSAALVSYYSIGSLCSVFITAALVKSLLRPAQIVFVYPVVSLITLIIMWAFPSTATVVGGAFVIGFFAAGGVLQLTITTMSELFPKGKGKAVGFINTMNSVAFFAGPSICGALAESNASNVILFDIIVTAIGVVLGLIVLMRYYKVIDVKATREKLRSAA